MNSVSCMTWVKRGASKRHPDRVALDDEELKKVIETQQEKLSRLEVEDDDDQSDSDSDGEERKRKQAAGRKGQVNLELCAMSSWLWQCWHGQVSRFYSIETSSVYVKDYFRRSNLLELHTCVPRLERSRGSNSLCYVTTSVLILTNSHNFLGSWKVLGPDTFCCYHH